MPLTTAQKLQRVKNRLKALEGLTPEQIRKFLRQRGIKGRMQSSGSCPIAKYVNYGCRAYGSYVLLDDQRVDAPDIHDFVEAFDNNKFPELVEG